MGWMSGAITRRWETTAAGQGGEPGGAGGDFNVAIGMRHSSPSRTSAVIALETSNLTKRRPRPAAGSRAGTRPRHQSSQGTKIEMEDET